MAERVRAWLLAALAATLCTSVGDAQGGRSNLPGGNNYGYPGSGPRGRPPTESQWILPPADKEKAGGQPDNSFFETMGGSKKGRAPLGPRAGTPKGRPKSGAKRPAKDSAKAPPPDPMKAADQVTATADHLARLDEAQRSLLLEHFRLCDLDENGWLSLREGEVTLALDRNEFRRTDVNQDGRLDEAEFAAQKELLLARLGARPGGLPPGTPSGAEPTEPVADPPMDEPPAPLATDTDTAVAALPGPADSELRAVHPSPAELVARYDEDGDTALGAGEIERFLGDAGLALVPELVVELYDRDDTAGLETAELYPLAWMASQRLPPPAAAAPGDAAGTSQGDAAAADAATARTLGGLTHFGRLDPDRDGYVTEAELRKLQSPVRLELRLRALLSGMDQDGDGRLSEAEFRASMGTAPR